ncbi:hypothetical protein ACHAQH_008921 [Verticillium albo-atrum]
MLGAANCTTFASNAADFQRYAQKKSDVLIDNLFGFPIANLIVGMFGNLVCASSQRIFGEPIWNPVDLLDMLQTAIFENALPAGNDMAALFPLSFLASYQIFLSAITGVLLVNYYLIARGHISMPDCFTSSEDGADHYTHGWNVRAYVAYIIGIIPNLYGFLNNMGVSAPTSVTRFYYLTLRIGSSFWASCKTWPPVILKTDWQEPKDYVRPEEDGDGGVIEALDSARPSPDIEGSKKLRETQRETQDALRELTHLVRSISDRMDREASGPSEKSRDMPLVGDTTSFSDGDEPGPGRISDPADYAVSSAPIVVLREIGRRYTGVHTRPRSLAKVDLVDLEILNETEADELIKTFYSQKKHDWLLKEMIGTLSSNQLRQASPFLHSVCCLQAIPYRDELVILLVSPLTMEEIYGVFLMSDNGSSAKRLNSEYIDSWMLTGYCANQAMLGISFSSVVSRIKSETATVEDQKAIRLWSTISLHHLQ